MKSLAVTHIFGCHGNRLVVTDTPPTGTRHAAAGRPGDTGDDKDHPTYHTWGHTDQQQLHLGGRGQGSVHDLKNVAPTTTDVQHLWRSKVMLGVMARIGTQPALTDTQPALTDTQPALADTQCALPDTQCALPDTQCALSDTQCALSDTQPAFMDHQRVYSQRAVELRCN